MGHPSQKLTSIRAIAISLLLMAVVGASAISAHQAQANGTDIDAGWTVQNRFTHEPLLSDTDGDSGVNHSPQDLPPSAAGERADDGDWTLMGLAIVVAVGGAFIFARRAR